MAVGELLAVTFVRVRMRMRVRVVSRVCRLACGGLSAVVRRRNGRRGCFLKSDVRVVAAVQQCGVV